MEPKNLKESVEAAFDHVYKRNDEIAQIKAKYPEGTSICLIKMGSDPQPVPPYTFGTVAHVDDIGTIHMRWKTGSSLGLIIGEDEFEIIHPTRVTLKWDHGPEITKVFARESEAIVFAAEAEMTCKEKKWTKPTVTYEEAKVGDLPDAYYETTGDKPAQ